MSFLNILPSSPSSPTHPPSLPPSLPPTLHPSLPQCLSSLSLSLSSSPDADLVIPNNKFVSTRHCQLLRDEEGRKWVRNTCTNGMLLNGKRVEKNKEVRRGERDEE